MGRFVPAIKIARRNGVFVYLLTLNHIVKPELTENCDIWKKEYIKDFDCGN